MRLAFFGFLSVGITCALASSCTDEGEDDVGTGGAATSTSTSGPATTTSTSSTSSSTGGGGGAGGGGGGCLDASVTAPYFSLASGALCAVERWTAEGLTIEAYGAAPTWGNHDGLLTFEGSTADVVVSRWSGTAGVLTAATETVPIVLPAGAFWGTQAVDTSATETVVGWTGMSFATEGGFVVVSGGNTAQEDAIGVFTLGVSQGRLLYTGLSAAGTAAIGNNALYAALVTSTTVTDDGEIASWGSNSGPIAVDPSGNVFVGLYDLGAGQTEIRAFAADVIGPGDPPIAGVDLVTLDDGGDAFAVVPATATEDGLLLLQQVDAATFATLDVIAVPFAVDAGAISAAGPATPGLTMTVPETKVTLTTAADGRVWVGAANAEGGTGAVFFVLDRTPPIKN